MAGAPGAWSPRWPGTKRRATSMARQRIQGKSGHRSQRTYGSLSRQARLADHGRLRWTLPAAGGHLLYDAASKGSEPPTKIGCQVGPFPAGRLYRLLLAEELQVHRWQNH